MKTTSSSLRHTVFRTPLSMVFEALDGTGHIVLVCKRDGTGIAYQMKDGELRQIDGVTLKFYRDGDDRIIDVHKGDRVILDLLVGMSNYTRQHAWLVAGNDVRMQLLRPGTYNLAINDNIAVVTRK